MTARYTVAVRTLCEFTAKAGDLDQRFTPASTPLEGMAGHSLVARRRGATYQAEVTLSAHCGDLLVRGRADGFDADLGLVEVKTYRGDFERIPANRRALHRAQALLYGAMWCASRAVPEVDLALIYVNVATDEEIVLREHCSAQELWAYFVECCGRFAQWAALEVAHRSERDAQLAVLKFSQGQLHPGQRQLAEAVYRSTAGSRPLLAQAPTGIGKTLGTLFPTLRACPNRKLDKVLFLTAKRTGRATALAALDDLRRHNPSLPLRSVELASREDSCEQPGRECHGESCPLARGFYDRLPAARQAAADARALDREGLRRIARAHSICPYYLGVEMVSWADVVVGDYNHYFDAGGWLHGLAQANEWRVAVLVDEAHNLVDRARAMYSCELDEERMRSLLEGAAGSSGAVAAAGRVGAVTGVGAASPALRRLLRECAALRHASTSTDDGQSDPPHRGAGEATTRFGSEHYAVVDEIPQTLLDALRDAIAALAQMLEHETPDTRQPLLLDLYFELLRWSRLAESFGSHSLFEVFAARVGIRNVVPASFVKPRLANAAAAVLFSATLAPMRFHGELLGVAEEARWLDVDSPFSADQLTVHRVTDVSTRFRDRDASLDRLVEVIARQYCGEPGNYLAFFSSFDYLQAAAARLAELHPDIAVWQQSPMMSEASRNAFLANFTPDGRGVGFAVLGGAFAEGVDLPGTRLIGAFIATLGLPPLTAANEQTRARLDQLLATGYEYTYLYPGLRKVVQAAGRVIRTQSDRGTLYLLDDRFGRADVRELLPEWWHVAPWSLRRAGRAQAHA